MGNSKLPGALASPHWKAGGEFTASELQLDQRYRAQRIRRHLRLVHGWGVVCGLNVVPANDAGNGWELFVCPGYGVGPCGDEILVKCRFRFNLRNYLWTRPLRSQSEIAWIGIEAVERPSAWVAAPEPDCGCGCSDGEKPSRFEDGFRVVVTWTRPPGTKRFNICGGGTPPCPPCPESCALILAAVSARSWTDAIANLTIRNSGEF